MSHCRALALALCAAMAPALALEGTVTRVSDGDTLWLRPAAGGKPVKVRMLGIDAPEMCQSGGDAARAALSAKVLNRSVRLEGSGRDDHSRRLARVWLGAEDVGASLVRDGHAWSYRFRSDPGPYAALQGQAREARRGVFAQPGALEPRDFRRRHGPCDAPAEMSPKAPAGLVERR